jgi:hypothetical protein
MSPEEQIERAKLAATAGLPDYTREVVLHYSTPIEVARQLVALASPNPSAASAAMREAAERAERLDRECGIAGPAKAGFDATTQTQRFGAKPEGASRSPGDASGVVIETFEQRSARNRGR